MTEYGVDGQAFNITSKHLHGLMLISPPVPSVAPWAILLLLNGLTMLTLGVVVLLKALAR